MPWREAAKWLAIVTVEAFAIALATKAAEAVWARIEGEEETDDE